MLSETTLTFFLKLLTFKSHFSTVLNLELCQYQINIPKYCFDFISSYDDMALGAWEMPEAYSELSQTSKTEQNAPSQMLDWVLNTPPSPPFLLSVILSLSYFSIFSHFQTLLGLPPHLILLLDLFCFTTLLTLQQFVRRFLKLALREKCPNTEFFLVRILLYSE